MQVSSENKSDRQKILSDPKTRELLRRLIVDGKSLAPEVGTDGLVHYLTAEDVIGRPPGHGGVDRRRWSASGCSRRPSSKELVTCPIALQGRPAGPARVPKVQGEEDEEDRPRRAPLLRLHRHRLEVRQGRLPGLPQLQEADTQGRRAAELRRLVRVPELPHEDQPPEGRLHVQGGARVQHLRPRARARVHLRRSRSRWSRSSRTRSSSRPRWSSSSRQMGYAVFSPATLQGRSGTSHTLDVYASKGVDDPKGPIKDVAIQIAVDAVAVEPSAVISFFAKTYDLRPKLAILITIPSASDAAKQINAGLRDNAGRGPGRLGGGPEGKGAPRVGWQRQGAEGGGGQDEVPTRERHQGRRISQAARGQRDRLDAAVGRDRGQPRRARLYLRERRPGLPSPGASPGLISGQGNVVVGALRRGAGHVHLHGARPGRTST